jgi:hypothetical protein
MCAGADSIDDIDVVRCGGMKTLFDGVYAPSSIGTLLREFSFGHARQLESVLRTHLGALCGRVDLLWCSIIRQRARPADLLCPQLEIKINHCGARPTSAHRWIEAKWQ